MSFKIIFPNIAKARPNPPGVVIANISDRVRVDSQTTPVTVLLNKFLFNYLLASGERGYLYACTYSDGSECEALVSVDIADPYTVEICRLGSTEQKVYYNDQLIATWSETPNAEGSLYGYITFKAYGYNWLTGWDYRKRFRVDGSSGGAVTNYQIKLTVNRSSGSDSGNTVYLDTKCNADFSDLRFTTHDGETELDYWIESISGTVCTVWIELDSVGVDPNTADFFLYYGNSGASDQSDGEATFPFFDDFPGSSLDTSKWTGPDTGDCSVSSSILTFANETGAEHYIESLTSKDAGYRIRSRTLLQSHAGGYYHTIQSRATGNSTPLFNMGALTGNTSYIQWYIDAGNNDNQASNLTLDAYHIHEMWHSAIRQVRFYEDDVEVNNSPMAMTADYSLTREDPIIPNAFNSTMKIDWILFRQYIDPDIDVSSWGAEENV